MVAQLNEGPEEQPAAEDPPCEAKEEKADVTSSEAGNTDTGADMYKQYAQEAHAAGRAPLPSHSDAAEHKAADHKSESTHAHVIVGNHDITKEAKGLLQHAFVDGGRITRDQWLATYDRFLADFEEADINHDGKLDVQEWTAAGEDEENFAVYDLNGDGTIDASEYAHARHTEKELRKLDADGDGKISREEWVNKYGSDAGFDDYDLDGDGVIDADEFRKCKAGDTVFEEMICELDADGDGKISREEWVNKYGSDAGFDDYDLDGDGVIDADEFRGVHAAKIDFTRLDKDGDGVISREEWIGKYGNDDGFDEIAGEDGVIDGAELRRAETVGCLSKSAKQAAREIEALAPQPEVVSSVPVVIRESRASIREFQQGEIKSQPFILGMSETESNILR